MRAVAWVVISLAFGLGGGTSTQAYDAPAIVIPGKRGVPVIINGYDASYCVVESDWGLARPGHVTPNIIVCPLIVPGRGAAGSYYPTRGRRPGYGRMEVEPPANRRLPPPAPSYRREWSSESDALPASLDPPAELPPLLVAPERDWRRRRFGRPH